MDGAAASDVMVAPRIGAGLDGNEPVIAVAVRPRAARAGKIRIERCRVLIDTWT